ncbi:hypothetical protein B5X24_HaOG201783 [Helicoverpa armigera]|nr:hypothetical protein B5X24_HaOG201783 [Helicoverpa armigera]
MVQSPFFDGKQPNWHHEDCFFHKTRPTSVREIANFNKLKSADQDRIKSVMENSTGIVMPVEKPKGKGKSKKRAADDPVSTSTQLALKDFRVEYSKSSRATCKQCEIKICKDEVRICKIVYDTEVGSKYGGQPLWHHVKCFAEKRAEFLFFAGGESLPGFDTLSKEDKAMVKQEIKYWLFRAWGRIGTTIGGSKVEDCKSVDEAIRKFEDLYMEKTDNDWSMRDYFMKVPGRYFPLDMDYSTDDVNTQNLAIDNKCELPVPVQKLIIKIFDVNIMKKTLLEFELDTEKMPLGKLSKKQIKSGYKILSELLTLINKGSTSQNKIIDATNRFFTLIPHDFGVNNAPLLDNVELIKTKTAMLDNLLEIEIAYSLMKTDSDESNVMSAHYLKLKANIAPLPRNSPEFEMIQEYVRNTHAATHSSYTLEIEEVFKVVREGEDKRFKPFKKLHNRRLLWHGSRTTNFAGIISQGLRIAPPEAPVTGYMFGKGVYFADMVSKSANYCCTSINNPTGLMLLCEVALGNMQECYRATDVKLPPNMHSAWGVGGTQPDPAQNRTLDDGTIVPLGKPVQNKVPTTLLYNEFIVYDVAQVNVKYLLQMKFKHKY